MQHTEFGLFEGGPIVKSLTMLYNVFLHNNAQDFAESTKLQTRYYL